MGWSDRLQRVLLAIGFIASALLLIRFAVDFSAQMNAPLAVAFWALVAIALCVAGINIFNATKNRVSLSSHEKMRALLLAAIPLSFLASSLDCMGVSLWGCSPFCTFIKLVWVPLIAIACAIYFSTRRAWTLTLIAAMTFVPLAPHCVCYNAGNGWWIDRLGASPVCYGWGFAASVISVSALRAGARAWISLAVCGAIIAGATGFFVGHHYFHFPW